MFHIEEFYEFWRMVRCPKCKESNWLYDFHSQRHYPDVMDGCECHACGNKFFVGERKELEIKYINEIEEYGIEKTVEEHMTCEKGRKKVD
jgi:hypothetical protein